LNQEPAASAKDGDTRAAGASSLVSIILLAHNKADYTERCLSGLEATPYRPFEVVAVNNGSTDSTAKLLDERAARLGKLGVAVRRLDFERNVGAVVGRNRAVAKARGDFLVFLDNDVAPGRSPGSAAWWTSCAPARTWARSGRSWSTPSRRTSSSARAARSRPPGGSASWGAASRARRRTSTASASARR